MSERGYRRWLRLPFGDADLDREVDEEIEAHLAMRAEALVRAGVSPARAREEALRRFGDLDAARRRLRASARARGGRLRRGERLDGLRRDVRLAVRQARRSPGFSALAVATFALGIGLTTVMFTLVDRVLLRPLPLADPDRLVSLLSVDSAGNEFYQVSMGNWFDWRRLSRSIESTALLMDRSYTVSVGGEAERVPGQLVAGPFFDVLRLRLVAGRGFAAEETESGGAVAVVSESFWRERMGASRDLGEIVVDGRSAQVVGVVAAGQEFPDRARLWLPAAVRARTGDARNWVNWWAVARLRDGVSLAAAHAELSGIADRVRAEDPAGIYSHGVGVRPLQAGMVEDASESLLLLMGGVCFVLLVACLNLAGLGLARATSRMREVAVRMAIGAGRARVLRQLITEVLVLAAAGGLLGVGVAWIGTRLIVARLGHALPRAAEIGIDGRVLAVVLLACVVSGLIAAVAPALRASGVPLRALMGADRRSVAGGRNLPGAALVCAEVALALLLLTGGGLLVRSFLAVIDNDLGFDAQDVLIANIALAGPAYLEDPAHRLRFWDELVERVRAIPGVESAGLANWVPTVAGGTTFLELEGGSGRSGAGYRIVGDDYFRTLRVPLLRGRAFEASDGFGSERVAVVNRSFAERLYAGADPIGRRVRAVSMENELEGPPWIRIIGVVADVRHWGHERDPDPEMFVLHRQLHTTLTTAMSLVIRASPGALPELPGVVRRAVGEIDPALAPDLNLLTDAIGFVLLERRVTAGVLSAFALLALALAAIGIYGLVAFAVAQRTREIGVRAALGARRARIIRLMLGNALRVVLAGVVLGALGAWWLGRLMSGMLVDVRPADPLTFGVAATLLILVAVFAALAPSLRAARLDPLAALRDT
jgi:predicted permease